MSSRRLLIIVAAGVALVGAACAPTVPPPPVPDAEPPVLSLPDDFVVPATSVDGMAVTYSATATDNVNGSRPVTCSIPSGSTFPMGTTAVGCAAIDAAGNTAVGTFTVTVKSVPLGVSAGGTHTCARMSLGTVKCWGSNGDLQLGYNNFDEEDGEGSKVPIPVDGITATVDLNASTYGNCAVGVAGSVTCWGYDSVVSVSRTSWVIPNITNATQVAGGMLHACAIVATGGVKCWGDDFDISDGPGFGVLGNGTLNPSAAAVDVLGIDDAESIDAGSSSGHTCVARAIGEVACWGRGIEGQLGDGTSTNAATPVDVAGVAEAEDVAAGTAHSCAATADGTVQCWGSNASGQLGDGTATMSATAVDVVGLDDAVSIDSLRNTTCALTGDGEVWCWGSNSHGQLGNGTIGGFSATPLRVLGITGATSISVGGEHACVTTPTYEIKCWGMNGWGVLGNGSDIDSASPVTVVGL